MDLKQQPDAHGDLIVGTCTWHENNLTSNSGHSGKQLSAKARKSGNNPAAHSSNSRNDLAASSAKGGNHSSAGSTGSSNKAAARFTDGNANSAVSKSESDQGRAIKANDGKQRLYPGDQVFRKFSDKRRRSSRKELGSVAGPFTVVKQINLQLCAVATGKGIKNYPMH